MSENQPGPDHRPTDHDAGGESGMHELLGAYALDAVDADERASFEAHLATCPACADELDGLRGVLADLAESTSVAPPPALRARVLQGVTPSGTEGPTGPVPPGAEPTALPDNVRALRPAPGPSRRLLLAAALAFQLSTHAQT
ncbi:MAG TPA: zf-HC2 domain-containing protein, partial [Tetrasphaera sp.]|nr:zf-HC2 domain-containing protein [Tetrasphaera sp.]